MTTYYKVKFDKDLTSVYKNGKYYYSLVGGELITTAELKKMQQYDKRFENVNKYFEIVECSRKNSYFCFGTRFNTEVITKWLIECSRDAVNVDYSEIFESNIRPGEWECYDIANDHGCEFWTVSEFEEV